MPMGGVRALFLGNAFREYSTGESVSVGVGFVVVAPWEVVGFAVPTVYDISCWWG